MKVRVKKEFELHDNYKVYENYILELITINYENDSFFVILENAGHIFNVYFRDEFDVNEHIEFNYQEKCRENTFIEEDTVKKMIEEAREKGYKEAEIWKNKFLKLAEKI